MDSDGRERGSRPARMAEAARRFGLRPAPLIACRVLVVRDDGDPLTVLSGRFPDSGFVVAGAKLLAAGEALGRFDYVVVDLALASWSGAQRVELFCSLSRVLAERGLALLEYVTPLAELERELDSAGLRYFGELTLAGEPDARTRQGLAGRARR